MATRCGLCLIVLALAGCGAVDPGAKRAPDPPALASVPPVDSAAFRASNAVFAGRLLGVVDHGDANVALSPFSISQALAMTSAGARGRTLLQMERALGIRLSQTRLHAAFAGADRALAMINQPGVVLKIANALYGQQGEPFRRRFVALLSHDYGAGMQAVDFEHATEQARATINAWVSERTHGKIRQLIPPGVLDQFTRLVLVNAVYLHARWQSPFDRSDTAPAPFHSPHGTVNVPTMHQTGTFGYLRRAGYQALELPYRGGRLALDILLPDPGGLGALQRRVVRDGPLKLLGGLQPTQLGVALPRLRLRTSLELSDALKALGMRLAFLPGQADFSGIAEDPGDLYIKAVIHQAYLQIDEAGTKAAAATGVIVATESAVAGQAITFNVNRPFTFVLRDTRTDAILFLGTVYRP